MAMLDAETWLSPALDSTGAIRRWLQDVAWTLCQSGNKLCDGLIESGFQGDPVERCEAVLASFDAAGLIVRGKPDPMLEHSGRAMAQAWSSVSFEEKRRCWAWTPGSSCDAMIREYPPPR